MMHIYLLDLLAVLTTIMAIIFVWKGKKNKVRQDIKFILIALLALLFSLNFLNLLEWSGITSTVEPIEDYPSIMAPLMWIFFFYSIIQRKSEEKIHSLGEIVQQIPSSVITTDLEFKIKWINKAFEDLYGYTFDEIKNKSPDFLNAEPLAQEIQEEIYKTVSDGKIWFGEALNKKKDGTTFTVEMEIIPLRDDKRKIFAYAGFQKDITDRKQIEDTLKESEEKFRLLAEHSPNMIGIVSPKKGHVVYVNKKASELLGYTQKEILSPDFNFFGTISSDTREKAKEYFNRVIKGEDFPPHELSFITKKGEKISTLVSSKGIDFGRERALLGIVTDITDRKKAQKEIETEKQKLENIVEGINAGLTLLDSDTNIIWSNKIIQNWFGPEKKIDGCSCADLYGLKDPTKECASILSKKSGRVESGESFVTTLDGKKRYFQLTSVPIKEKNGKIIQFVELTQDITETKTAQEALKVAYEELKSIDKLKRDIIANVTHELRTPITIVMSSMEILRHESDAKKRDDLLDIAIDSMHRQDTIIGDLIEASQLGGIEKGIELKKEDISKIIKKVSSEFTPPIEHKKIKTNVKIQKNIPKVICNKKQVEHILRNIINNAIKFNKVGGKMSIEATKKGKFVEIGVTDTGIGMSKKDLPRVFDRFFQADSSTSRIYGGTGLGLSVVKDMVEANGGTIDAKSTLGKGTTFCFTLPITEGGR